jgi:hypothetical protein
LACPHVSINRRFFPLSKGMWHRGQQSAICSSMVRSRTTSESEKIKNQPTDLSRFTEIVRTITQLWQGPSVLTVKTCRYKVAPTTFNMQGWTSWKDLYTQKTNLFLLLSFYICISNHSKYKRDNHMFSPRVHRVVIWHFKCLKSPLYLDLFFPFHSKTYLFHSKI